MAQTQPASAGTLFELGSTLRRARQYPEAIEAFRSALRLNSNHSDALLGLAMTLASTGNRKEALLRYDEVLARSPDNYEALQGKGHVLFWNKKYAEARTIFEKLAAKKPSDKQNPRMLKRIGRAEESARWAALRPPRDAPPQEFVAYFQKRLASYPDDMSAIKGLAYNHARLKNYPAAIDAYRKVLATYPDDHGSKIALARILSWEGQYAASIRLYQELLEADPDDTGAMEGLARVYSWSARPHEALEIYKRLLAKEPGNAEYQLRVARLQVRLKDSPAAREFLTAVLGGSQQSRCHFFAGPVAHEAGPV